MSDGQLKLETLESAKAYILRLIGGIDNIYVLFQSGKESQGYEMLGQLLEGIDWLTKAIALTSDMQPNQIEIEEINGILADIEASAKKNDITLLSDLIVYELKPLFENWNKLMLNL